MGALADLVSMLIGLDVGTRFLHFLDKDEGLPADDGRVMIIRSLDYFWLVPDPLHRGIPGTHRPSIDRVSRVLFIGEDVVYGAVQPFPLPHWTRDAEGLQ